MVETIRELTSVVDTRSVYSAHVLTWATIVEAQKSHTVMLDSIKETKGFDAITLQK